MKTHSIQNIHSSETGRSMVEMIGVLAVMGVLTVGGVAGYRYAVDKMNANEIINEIKKRAVTASQQRLSGQDTIDLKEYYPNAEVDMIRNMYEVAVEPSYQNNEGFFALEVYDIPKGICRQILQSDWSMPVATELNEIVVNDGTECNEGDDNKILFAFSNTLGSGNAGNSGNTGTSGRPPVDPNNECAKNDVTPLRDRSGNCHSCDESDIINIKDSGDCSVCDGSRGAKRYVAANRDLYGKSCVLASDCPAGSVPNDQTGYCDCPEGQIMTWWSDRCLPCGEAEKTGEYDRFKDIFVVSVLEDNADNICATCGWQATDRDLYHDAYGVRQCIVSGTYVPPSVSTEPTTQTETTTITVTETPEMSRVCDEQQIQDKYGNCYDCSYESEVYGISNPSEECSRCDGSGYQWVARNPPWANDPQCIPCSLKGYISDTEDNIEQTCHSCGLGVDWRYMIDSFRRTYNCAPTSEHIGTKPGTVSTVTEVISTVTQTGTPEISLPQGACFNTDKGCIPCDSLEGIGGDHNPDCSACGSMRSTSYGNNCWLTTCPDGYMHDFGNFGTCIPCSQMEQAYDSDLMDRFKTECEMCGGTRIGQQCVPNSEVSGEVTEAETEVTESTELDETATETESTVTETTTTVTQTQTQTQTVKGCYYATGYGCLTCDELEDLPAGTRIRVASSTASISSCPILKTNNIATNYAYIPCPSNAPINEHGTCYSCYDEINSPSDLEDRCSECPNRYQWNNSPGNGEAPTCSLCPSNVSTITSSDTCEQCGGTWNNGKCS